MIYHVEKLRDGSIIIWGSCKFGMYPLFRFTQPEAREIINKLSECVDNVPEVFNYE